MTTAPCPRPTHSHPGGPSLQSGTCVQLGRSCRAQGGRWAGRTGSGQHSVPPSSPAGSGLGGREARGQPVSWGPRRTEGGHRVTRGCSLAGQRGCGLGDPGGDQRTSQGLSKAGGPGLPLARPRSLCHMGHPCCPNPCCPPPCLPPSSPAPFPPPSSLSSLLCLFFPSLSLYQAPLGSEDSSGPAWCPLPASFVAPPQCAQSTHPHPAAPQRVPSLTKVMVTGVEH